MRLSNIHPVATSFLACFSTTGIAILLLGCAARPAPVGDTATLELQTGQSETKIVSVTIGEAPLKIVERCRPAQPSADDDPWIAYPAMGGGMYVVFFDPGVGTKDDPTDDRLIAVARYTPKEPGGSIDGQSGVYLLPADWSGRECPWDYLVGRGSPKTALDASAIPSSEPGSR